MKKLSAYNEANDRVIDMMVGKAMCAYANWQMAQLDGLPVIAQMSEYEATVICISMLVNESVPAICQHIIDRCKEEFGV